MWKWKSRIAFALLALGGTGAPWAHDDAAIAKLGAPNGGQQKAAGQYHLELLMKRDGDAARERALVVFVTDHDGKKISTAGGSGSAVLLAGKTKLTVPLAPDGDNRLKASAAYPSAAELKVSVSVSLPGRAVEQARFTPFEARAR